METIRRANIMKRKKIRNIDIDVCCGEQVLCYNMCFNSHINFGKDSEGAKKFAAKHYFPEVPKKFNVYLISVLFEKHIDKYMGDPKIFWDYKRLGEFFTI